MGIFDIILQHLKTFKLFKSQRLSLQYSTNTEIGLMVNSVSGRYMGNELT
jgi:hypothetical protein